MGIENGRIQALREEIEKAKKPDGKRGLKIPRVSKQQSSEDDWGYQI